MSVSAMQVFRTMPIVSKNIMTHCCVNGVLLAAVPLSIRRQLHYGVILPFTTTGCTSTVALCGPPGTGKTVMAMACAAVAGVPVMLLSPSDVITKNLGASEIMLSNMLNVCNGMTQCILILDEVDAWGMDKESRIWNCLMSELRCLVSRPGYNLVVIATTNAEGSPAALRDIFHHIITLPLPSTQDRVLFWRHLLALHCDCGCCEPVPCEALSDQDITLLADKTSSRSCKY